MNPQEQRIKIAEACGWKRNHLWDDSTNNRNAWEKDGRIVYTYALPNYCNDLNAMHEVEKSLGDKKYFYVGELESVCGVEDETQCPLIGWALLHATASKRAEAFLKTLGLWKSS